LTGDNKPIQVRIGYKVKTPCYRLSGFTHRLTGRSSGTPTTSYDTNGGYMFESLLQTSLSALDCPGIARPYAASPILGTLTQFLSGLPSTDSSIELVFAPRNRTLACLVNPLYTVLP